VVKVLEVAPDNVYEIRDASGELVGSATADGRGGWHVWVVPSASKRRGED